MMKNIFVTTILLSVVLFVSACSSEELTEPTVPDTVPETPEVPDEPVQMDDETSDDTTADPVEGDANIINAPSEQLGGGSDEALGSEFEDVACSMDERKITFTFKNVGQYTWSLDQEVGFGAGGDVRNIKVFLNHRYEMNANRVNYHPETGEVMFGPNELFSDNCGGVKELEVGESATCTLYPVPLNIGAGSTSQNGVNYIVIDSPAIDDIIRFQC